MTEKNEEEEDNQLQKTLALQTEQQKALQRSLVQEGQTESGRCDLSSQRKGVSQGRATATKNTRKKTDHFLAIDHHWRWLVMDNSGRHTRGFPGANDVLLLLMVVVVVVVVVVVATGKTMAASN